MALGLSADGASKAAGKPDSIRNLRRAAKSGDRQGITTATLTALAPVLRTTTWLLEGSGAEDVEDTKASVPVWGKAGAGGEVHAFHEMTGPIGAISMPGEMTDATSAVEITGESLGRLFDGWFAIYDDIRHPPTEDLLNALCIVALDDGRIFIKRLKKGRGRKFTLESNYEAPIYDVAVRWAARVKSLVPS